MEKLTEKQRAEKEAFEKELDKEHGVILKKREMIVLFNMMTTMTMKYGDFVIIEPIIKKFEPILAVDSNIPQDALTGIKN